MDPPPSALNDSDRVSETPEGKKKRSSEEKVINPAISLIPYFLLLLLPLPLSLRDAERLFDRKEQQLEQAYIAMTGDEKERREGGGERL